MLYKICSEIILNNKCKQKRKVSKCERKDERKGVKTHIQKTTTTKQQHIVGSEKHTGFLSICCFLI